jgi:hypothetical protein
MTEPEPVREGRVTRGAGWRRTPERFAARSL